MAGRGSSDPYAAAIKKLLKYSHTVAIRYFVSTKEARPVSQSRFRELRRWLAPIFEDEEPRNLATHVFNTLLTALIIVNVTGVVLETVDSIRQQYAGALESFERIATAIFAVEYVLRIWACVDFHHADYRDPLWGRLRYMRSFFAVVDLVAVLPAVLGILGAADLRVLRLLRLLRMLKLIRYSTTFGLLWAVLKEELASIAALLFILFLTVTVSGTLMFLLETDERGSLFTSIPVGMWWAIETLTTVGYGDLVPMTVVGRLLGGVVSIVGIGTLALFSGLITIGFLDQLKLYREHHPPHASKPMFVHEEHKSMERDGTRVEISELTVSTLDPASTGSPPHSVCPHCGFALSNPTSH
jgi:voltage-gated potassium channel